MNFIASSLGLIRRQPVLYRMLGLGRLTLFQAELARRNWLHRRAPPSDGGLPLPPPALRFRVGGSFDPATFLRIGGTCAEAIREAARAAGTDMAACRAVLDFSCGCGRVTRHFRGLGPALHGADIDGEAIAWCRENLAGLADFRRTGFEPPLPYADGQFDLVYVVSLFTHLDERLQDLWLAEIARILAPGGLLVATLHGAYSQRYLPAAEAAQMAQSGFVFQIGQTGRLKLDGLPDYYQAAYHSHSYVRAHWGRWLKPILFRERGMNDDQDLVVLRKPQ